LIFPYSPWLVIICLLVGFVFSFALYRRDKRLVELAKPLIIFLASIRFVSASLLAILLLSPLVKYISRSIAEPIIIIAQDNSASMVLSEDSSFVKNELLQEINALKQELGGNYQVEHYSFGEKFSTAESLEFTDRYSNFEQLFSELQNRYENRNVGAMLMISDGIFNRGMNPIYASANLPFPIYSLALGDTNQRKDLLISNVIHNKIAFLGNQFPIRVEYKALKANGQETKVRLLKAGKVIEEKEISLESNSEYKEIDFVITAEESGLQTYQVQIVPLQDENVKENNYRNIYIDVLDSRQKILIAYQSPHPDIAALKKAISFSENYKLEIVQIDKWNKDLKSYDLILAHGLLSRRSALTDELISGARKSNLPILFFTDQSTDWAYLNSLGSAIQASNPTRSMNEVYALYDQAFPLFKIDDELAASLKSFPPLKVPQATYKKADQSFVLFRQQIGNVPTKFPMLSFVQLEQRKEGVFVGEGLWRWRMNSFMSTGNHKQFDQLISKVIQYLSVKADKSYFRISYQKELMENEKMRFDLQLFNKAYDPINDPDAYMVISDEDGNEFNYQFNRSSNAYFLDLAGMKVGNYSFRAYTDYNGQKLEERGNFRIQEIMIESVQTVADHNILYQIAQKSGGEVIYNLDAKSFTDELNARSDIRSLSYTSEDVEDIINLKWIFFILLFLLAIEWFIRKYSGAY